MKVGDIVTVTFDDVNGFFSFTVKAQDGKPKQFEVLEKNGKLGIMYPGRNIDGIWCDAQFTPFEKFSFTVKFTRRSDNKVFYFSHINERLEEQESP